MSIAGRYTVAEAAKKLGLTHEYTLRLAKDYGLLRHKFGSSYVLDDNDIAVLRERQSYSSRRGRRYDRHGRKPDA
jgi:excisionase family DNA binding protein